MGQRRQEADAKHKRKRAITFAAGIIGLLVLFLVIVLVIVALNA